MFSLKELREKKFWHLSADEVSRFFETNAEKGLSGEMAEERLSLFGRNAIQVSKRTTRLQIFLNQLKSPLIFVLVFAGIITLAISHYRDAIFIFFAVIINSFLGFYQENKAENALAALKTYLKPRTRVIRNSQEREIDAEEIVPGDIIRLAQGDRVPADARVIYVNDLQIDETVLTGESLPVIKSPEPVSEKAALTDQASMIFAGTLVTQGVCTAIVCKTGPESELGKIAALVGFKEPKTPLQAAIIKFSVSASIILGGLTFVVFLIGIFSGYSVLDMFLTSVAIAISSIPEGLPVSMTVILAVGVERMAKRKGLVRKLVAAEALGSTTVILTDKTGTLTMAKMVLAKIITFGKIDEKKLIMRALTNANVLVENPEDDPDFWRMNGRIMETALARGAAIKGISFNDIMDKQHVLQSIPFNAVSKFSVSLIKEGSRSVAVLFGAPDILISHANLPTKEKKALVEKIDELASAGERVLGVATKEIAGAENFSLAKNFSPSQLSFDGLITFRDPVRPGIKKAMQSVAEAGVKTVILTGDHRGTAVSVAREIGMNVNEHSVLDASELALLSEDDLKRRLPNLTVISRVTPFDKLRIAKLFQESGEIVAMTGDGVNDAPSIKQTDIGIAMGSGTEVTQSVADLVLLDDNFETIVAAIEEGRRILVNIRKVIIYFLSDTLDELMLIGGSLIMGVTIPLNALQILWVNFFSDSFPAMAFAFEKEGNGLSRRLKKGRAEIFDPLTKLLILVIGFSTSTLLFFIYFWLLRAGFDPKIVRTFIFAAFGVYTLIVAFSLRSLDKSILSYPLFSNHYLTAGVSVGLILMAAGIYHPGLRLLLGTAYLPPIWLLGVLGIGVMNVIIIEIAKYFFKIKRAG